MSTSSAVKGPTYLVGRNVRCSMEGTELIIRVETAAKGDRSKGTAKKGEAPNGDNVTVATTGQAIFVPGVENGLRLQLTAYRPPTEAERKAW